MSVEELAKLFYDTYCTTVGDPLPWEEFAADPTKQKQAGGWRAVASVAATTLVPRPQ